MRALNRALIGRNYDNKINRCIFQSLGKAGGNPREHCCPEPIFLCSYVLIMTHDGEKQLPNVPSGDSVGSMLCPACGAGTRREIGGQFKCSACGLARRSDAAPTEKGSKSRPSFPSLPAGRILIRSPEPQTSDWDEAGRPLPGAPVKGIYDAIVLLYHLERAPDPMAEMRAARRLLKPGGLLYLDVGKDGAWSIPLNAVRRMIENAGFKVERRLGWFKLRFRCRPS